MTFLTKFNANTRFTHLSGGWVRPTLRYKSYEEALGPDGTDIWQYQYPKSRHLVPLFSEEVLIPQNKEYRRAAFDRRSRGRATERSKDERSRRTPGVKPKKKRSKKCFQKEILTPHAGTIGRWKAKLSAVKDIVMESDFHDRAEPVLDIVENVYLLLQNLRKAADASHAFHILLAHIKLFTKKSISGWVIKFLTDELGFDARNRTASETLSDFEDTNLDEFSELYEQAGDQPEWLRSLKTFSFNWKTFANCDGGKTVCKVVSMCAAMGLCDLSDLDIKWGDVKLFSVEAYKKQVTAVDLATAVTETIVFFAEGGYRVFETGRIESFFMTDDNIKKAEARYFQIVECAPLLKAGNLLRVKNMDDNDYSLLLDKAIEEHSDLMQRTTDGWVKKAVMDRLVHLKRYKADFNAYCVDGAQRVAPFGLYIYGAPGVGKSTVQDVLIRAILKANGFSADDERIVTIKDGDTFDSTMRSSTNAAIFDDLGNTQAQYTSTPPTQRIIEFKNNVPAYANMAEADLKGKVRIAIKVLSATSNVTAKSIARTYSNAPASFSRRFDTHLHVRVREGFSLPDGRIDPKKVLDRFGSDLVPDCYDIDFGVPDENCKTDFVNWKHKNQSFAEIIKHAVSDSLVYFAAQDAYVKRAAGMAAKLEPCTITHLPKEICSCILCNGKCDSLPEAEKKPVTTTSSDDEYATPFDHTRLDTDAELYQLWNDYCETWRQEGVKWDEKNQKHWFGFLSSFGLIPDDDDSTSSALTEQVGIRENDQIEPLIQDMIKIDERTFGLVSKLPDWVFASEIGTNLLLWLHRHRIKYVVFEDLWNLMIGACVLAYIFLWLSYQPSIFTPIILFMIWIYLRKYYLLREQVGQRIARSRNLHGHIWTNVRNCNVSDLMIRCASLYAFYKFAKMGMNIWSMKDKMSPEKRGIVTEEDVEKAFNSGAFPIPSHDGKGYRLHSDPHIVEELKKAEKLLYTTDWTEFHKEELDEQGKLRPDSYADVVKRDDEINPWATAAVSEMPKSAKGTTRISALQLEQLVSKNLFFMTVYRKDGTVSVCDALAACSGLMLIPNHMWRDDETLHATFTSKPGHVIGSRKKVPLSKALSTNIPGTDICACYCTGTGDHVDLRSSFFNENMVNSVHADVPAHMIYRKQDGVLDIYRSYLYKGPVTSTNASYMGYNYHLERPTFDGMCMGTWISTTTCPTIVGVHLCGKEGTTRGAAGIVSVQQIHSAMERLGRIPSVVFPLATGDLLTNQYGVEFFLSTDINPKSPINYLSHDANIEYYGQVKGKVAHTNSKVQPTIISDAVAEVCGVEQQWGKPKFHVWKPWQKSLEQSSHPSPGVEGHLVMHAVADYSKPLLERLKTDDEFKAGIRPLTDMEAICGIDGLRFVDRMSGKTSPGYPLSGTKDDYYIILDPEDHPGFACPTDVDQIIWRERDRMVGCYVIGERAYPVFKTCLKDEATKLDSDKVRAFQAAPIALQLLIRKYFLSIARYISIVPLDSECAVGINAAGPEWDTLTRHLKKFGEDRILAGDYSKYDLRMPAQLIFAAFDVMITIAQASGNYTDEDILIMRGIATDVAYPIMAYNGDLVKHIGSNPSGQNLTVYINSIVNSLLIRCAYFEIVKKPKPFRSVVALSTYGDDVKGSVSEEIPEFNHITLAAFLAERDMKFTMPDKTSTPTEYMLDYDADLLKRKNVFCEETGLYAGALSEDSIFKSLHAVQRSADCTPEQQAAQNIDGALREWFLHGKEKYEKRREQMNEIAKRAEISYLCKRLSVPYDEAMQEHKDRYKLDEQSGDLPLNAEELMRAPIGVAEEDQQRLITNLARAHNWRKVGFNIQVIDSTFGEIDAIFERHANGVRHIYLFELKFHYTQYLEYKARVQLQRYAHMLMVLQPNAHIRTYAMYGEYYELVATYGAMSQFAHPTHL